MLLSPESDGVTGDPSQHYFTIHVEPRP
jgi:hypothetical protein